MKKIFYENRFLFIPFGIAAILALVSFVVMQLWNTLLPDILHVRTITFWQAMGIFILSKILFGFGGKGSGGSPAWMRRKHMMEERFKNLSPEDRAQFKEQWQSRCGWGKRDADWKTNWQNETIAQKDTKE